MGGKGVKWVVREGGKLEEVKPSIRTAWTSYEFKKCQPQAETCFKSLREEIFHYHMGSISDPCLPCIAFHGSHCLSREFTWSVKVNLEKQTRQQSLVMAL